MASFSSMRLVNHLENGDTYICIEDKGFIIILEASKPYSKSEMHAFVWDKKASFSYIERSW